MIDVSDLERWDDERLEAEICSFAADLAAAEARWLVLVAEFDRRQGWGSWGCRSCAEWLSWQCSMAPGTAREHVRVARRLEAFPATAAVFAAGRLSYSKVRALTRVLTPANEGTLLGYAAEATAGQLERLVRSYKTVKDDALGGVDPEVERHLSWWWDADGMLVLEGRLAPEEGARLLAALGVGADALGDPPMTRVEASHVPAGTSDEAEPDTATEAEPSVSGGGGAIFSFVDDDGEVVTIGGPAGDEPEADEPGDPGDVPAETPTSGGGTRWADALGVLAETILAGGPAAAAPGAGLEVLVEIDLALLSAGDDDPSGRAAARVDGGGTLSADVAHRLLCDCGLRAVLRGDLGETLDIGRKTQSIPRAMRRALRRRDGGCQFPGCGQRRFVDGHHIWWWEAGGPTCLDNLILLCRRHHTLVHKHGWRIEGSPGARVFVRPDGVEAIAGDPGGVRTDITDPVHTRDDLWATHGAGWFDVNDAIAGILTADGIPVG